MLQNSVLTDDRADQRAHAHSMAGQKVTTRAGLISAVKHSLANPNAMMLTLCDPALMLVLRAKSEMEQGRVEYGLEVLI